MDVSIRAQQLGNTSRSQLLPNVLGDFYFSLQATDGINEITNECALRLQLACYVCISRAVEITVSKT